MKTVKVPIYGCKVHISVGDSPDIIIKYLSSYYKRRKLKLQPEELQDIQTIDSAKMLGIVIELCPPGSYLLWLADKDKLDHITLSHETIHVCIRVFKYVGSNINEETEEHFTYLHDHLMETCIKLIEGKKKDVSSNTGSKE